MISGTIVLMALRVYRKDNNPRGRRAITIVSYISLIAGTLMLFWALYPIVSFEVYSRFFFRNTVSTPVPSTQLASALELAKGVETNVYSYTGNVKDFTHASEWFPLSQTAVGNKKSSLTVIKPSESGSVAQIPAVFQNTPAALGVDNSIPSSYELSIPRLNISAAKVLLSGEDLSKSLIHFLPVSMPGENGNVVIFGHSTLPQLYNTTDYKTIFTYLPSLDKGDRVITKVRNVPYEYEIYDMFVVKPDQVSVLDQQYDSSYLTLITCVPPGTYWNRLVVKAKLVKQPSSL